MFKNSVDMCFAYEIIGEIYKLLIVWKKIPGGLCVAKKGNDER